MKRTKNLRKMLALVLTLAMLASVCMVSAFATAIDEEKFMISQGYCTTTGEGAEATTTTNKLTLGYILDQRISKSDQYATFNNIANNEHANLYTEEEIKNRTVDNLWIKDTENYEKPTIADLTNMTNTTSIYLDNEGQNQALDTTVIQLTPDTNKNETTPTYIYYKTNGTAISGELYSTEISCDIDPSYTVEIPTSVVFGKLVKNYNMMAFKVLNIKTSNVAMETGKKITITANSSTVTLTNSAKDELTVNLYAPGEKLGNETGNQNIPRGDINDGSLLGNKYDNEPIISYQKQAEEENSKDIKIKLNGTENDLTESLAGTGDTQKIVAVIDKNDISEPGTYSGTITFTLTYENIPEETEE